MKLGGWLISKGKITEEQLARALQDQTFFGGRLGHSLIKLGFVDEDILGAYLADISGSRYAAADRLENIPPEVIAAVPARLASQYRIVPIAIEGRKLHLAMRDPLDLVALDEIAFLTGLAIQPYVATEYRIHVALERHYQITVGTRTIPVAGDRSDPQPAPQPTPPAPPEASPESNIGLDGYPLDADPDDLDQPFRTSGPPQPTPLQGPPEALPTSMEEWRMAREEIPETFPEPQRASQAPAAAARPGGPSPAPVAAARPGGPVLAPTANAATAPWTTASLRALEPVAAPSANPPSTGSPVADPTPAPGAASPPAAAVTDAPAPAPSAAPTPTTLEALSERLRAADARDEVFDALLDFAAPHFRRCALFIVQPDRVLGWSGRGAGMSAVRVRNVTVEFDRPSLFVFFRKGGDYYYGPVPDLPANARFYLDLGCPPPGRVFLLPLTIKGRPGVILYADHGSDRTPPPDITLFRRAMRKAALALEILILKNKIMMV